ncbi:MAG: hypothetical protein C0594_12880 [Marinilabiliales bacterium]|nr:MAG: hypothetical protein C0594_12880 [Marinilabiliales bacterium]
MKFKQLSIIFSILFFAGGCTIEDLPRDNPNDGMDFEEYTYNYETGDVELYVTNMDYVYDLYINGYYEYHFGGYYTNYMSRDCGFDDTFEYVYTYSNYTGNYSYELKSSSGTVLHSGTFYIYSNQCKAIDLWPSTKNTEQAENEDLKAKGRFKQK